MHVCVLQKVLHKCITHVKIRVVNFRMEINFLGLDRVTTQQLSPSAISDLRYNHAVATATHVRLVGLHSSDRPRARDVRGNMLSPVTDVCRCVGDWSPVMDGQPGNSKDFKLLRQ